MNDLTVIENFEIAEIYDAIDNFAPQEKKSVVAQFKKLTKEAIFTPQSHDAIVALVSSEIKEFVGDISTEKGRKEIKDFAFKIAKIRNRIEDAKKEVTADWAERKKNVDTQARLIKTSLEDLEAIALQPLTDFQNAEKARIVEHEAKISEIEFYTKQNISDIATAQEFLNNLEPMIERDWQEFKGRAVCAFEASKSYINQQLARLQEIARQQAELAELNRKAEEARQKEREEQIRRDAEEKARKEAEAKAEAERQAILKAEQEKRDAELRKQREEQARIDAERLKKEREAQAKIDAERKKAQEEKEALEKKLAEQQAESDRLKREAEAKALKERQDAERAEADRLAREADLSHRKAINNKAVNDLLEHGITKEQAISVVTAIVKGLISNVKIEY